MSDPIVIFLVKIDCLDVIKDAEKVSLDGVRIGSLSQDFQEGRVRDKEEPWKDQSLLLEVASERFLTELQLLQQVREKLTECLISNTAHNDIGCFMCFSHDLHPRLVNVLKPLGFLYSERRKGERYE